MTTAMFAALVSFAFNFSLTWLLISLPGAGRSPRPSWQLPFVAFTSLCVAAYSYALWSH